MCGIAVVFRRLEPSTGCVVEAMTDCVAHRGPDGSGTTHFAPNGERGWSTAAAGEAWRLAFGHRRLSILDVSDAGRQPMSYRGRYWITYNGEVYNFVELRRELTGLGHQFLSGTDTEVILAAYAEWGPECFRRFRGMWALAICDLHAGNLVLCRDRLGIKPLYQFHDDEATYFFSEIKQVRSAGIACEPRRETLAEYLLTGYEPTDETFFQGLRHVPAGTWLEINLRDGRRGEPQSYWHPERISVSIFDRDEAATAVRAALAESVKLQLRSDVPVGCALSGGLDSSSIAALVAGDADLNDPLNAFTVAFPGNAVDESGFARSVVASARIRPHQTTPTPDAFLADLDRFIWAHDEPVGSLSQYAGYALAKLTRGAGVPVTLNGQGGDETLLGYWQSYMSYLYGRVRHFDLLTPLRHGLGALLPGGNPELLRQVPVMWRRFRSRAGAAGRLQLRSLNGSQDAAGPRVVNRVLTMASQERRLYEIRELHLPRLLKWDDRNLMAFSVEGRYPFLDHEFMAVALSCAESTLFARGWTKEPLRRGMQDLLPVEVLRRRDKSGFETPQAEWLCGPLRPTIERWTTTDSPLWTYVEPSDARRMAQLTWNSSGRFAEAAQALMRLFLADRWLRVCCEGSVSGGTPLQSARA